MQPAQTTPQAARRPSGAARRRPRLRPGAALPLLAAALAPGAAHADTWSATLPPMSYLTAAGTRNYEVVALLYGVMIISLVVIVVIGALVLTGSFRQRSKELLPQNVPVERGGSGMPWIYVGVGATLVVLLGVVLWNYVVLAAVAPAPRDAASFIIEVTGHQWWWEVRYVTSDPSRTFTTANEIHIPVGKPVRVRLRSDDVIHSFWIPKLTGKTDTIPGQTNLSWLEADHAGVYRGQCTEYCGLEHAKMGVLVIADRPAAFDAWWQDQLAGAVMPDAALAQQGQADFMRRCAVCHTVRGTAAGGRVGPDLSHLMTRRSIAAATLPNTIGYLSGWIAAPQHVKPGNYMPTLDLPAPELTRIDAYLETLR